MNAFLTATGVILTLAVVGCESPQPQTNAGATREVNAAMAARDAKEAKEAKQAREAKDAKRAELREKAAAALAKLRKTDPSMDQVLKDSQGYAVFPTVGKGAVGVGGAHGDGVLYEGGYVSGYCELSQASIGLQLGGQSYTEVIVFSTKDAINHMKVGSVAFDAQATAVAAHSGSGANAKYRDGVAVFTTDEAGLMFEASLGGQKFSYEPK